MSINEILRLAFLFFLERWTFLNHQMVRCYTLQILENTKLLIYLCFIFSEKINWKEQRLRKREDYAFRKLNCTLRGKSRCCSELGVWVVNQKDSKGLSSYVYGKFFM